MTRPIDAIGSALTTTRHVLFEPFDAAKYVTLGFCVWLARLGSMGGASSGSASRSTSSRAATPEMDPGRWRDAIEPALALGWLLAVIVVGVVIVAVALVALVLFLQSRGVFLVMDGISKNRGAVVEPWAVYKPEGDALFRFRLAVNLGAAAVGAVLLGFVGLAVWSTWAGLMTPIHIALLGTAASVTVVLVLAAVITDALAVEFVAPLMYARRYAPRDGFRDLWAFVRTDLGGFAVYLVLRLVASVVASALAGALACLTCGLALVPFVGTLILLPVFLYLRVFSMHFVAQWADDLPMTLRPG